MKDDYTNQPEGPTEPVRQPGQEPSPPSRQGKLVLGGFQKERKPYQFPYGQNAQGQNYPQGPQNQQNPNYPQNPQGASYSQKPQNPNSGQNQQYPQNPNSGQNQQYGRNPGTQRQAGGAPASYAGQQYGQQGYGDARGQAGAGGRNQAPVQDPNVRGYPQRPPVQNGGAAPQKKRRSRRRVGCLSGCLVVLVLFVVLGVFTFTTLQRVLAFGSAISTQSPLSTQTGYLGSNDRVNLLIMGYGGSGHDGAYLTDSMMVMSLLPQSHHTTLVSVPRDLWVQIPPGSGQYAKLNYAYVSGSDNGKNPDAGGNMAAQKVALVTGLNVKYWLTINFSGFRDFINSIGGIDVYVPDAFTANYPANDDPSINASWKVIHFSKGMQHMDGERAIEYARARYVTDNLAEGTDFARSARQQIIMKAALSKLRQFSTWSSLYNALTALQHTIYTNMSLADLAEFALKMDLNNAHRVGLSNQNVLVDATSSDGQSILLPVNNNWQGIKDYVKQQLYN